MSKKDYQAIARAIHQSLTGMDRSCHWDAVQMSGAQALAHTVTLALADVMAQGNPRFNRARFIEACETGACKGMRK